MDEQSGSKANRGELAEKILDRIAGDEAFRRQLLNSPAETLKDAGYDTSNDVSGYTILPYPIVPPPPDPPTTTAIGCGGGGGGSDSDLNPAIDPPQWEENAEKKTKNSLET